jgi:hypothetical protein
MTAYTHAEFPAEFETIAGIEIAVTAIPADLFGARPAKLLGVGLRTLDNSSLTSPDRYKQYQDDQEQQRYYCGVIEHFFFIFPFWYYRKMSQPPSLP